jgi:hypothetical protein
MTMMHHVLNESGPRPVTLVVAADVANYDLFVQAGSPLGPVDVVLTINSGVTIYSSSGNAALYQSSSFPVGSTVNIINNGTICGRGGNAGGGHNGPGSGGAGLPGSPGGAAGDAIALSDDWTIDNTYGNIFGGGGGGSGGYSSMSSGAYGDGGGGGGGGQGRDGGAHGSGGAAGINGTKGNNGGNGSVSTYGRGGARGGDAGDGADGGSWGNKGGNTFGGSYGTVIGGAPGDAITLNGHTATFIGGNNPSQVKGAVA